MIGVFKKRDGWTLEKELPNERPRSIYKMPMLNKLPSAELYTEETALQLPEPVYKFMQFGLIDYWQDSYGNYIKVFYEEL